MNKNQKISLIIIIIGLLLIGAIVYFFFIKEAPVPGSIIKDPEVPIVQLPAQEDLTEVTPGDRPRNKISYDISKEEEHQVNATDVAKIAASFAERLGSFSNQSNYANFEDANIFMTKSMREWALTHVAKLRADNIYDGNYYGITTKTIATEIVKFDDNAGESEIIISTQRREVSVADGEKSYNQDLRLTFVKENNQWLVDGAYWLQ